MGAQEEGQLPAPGLQDNNLLVCFMNETSSSAHSSSSSGTISGSSSDNEDKRFSALARANISSKKEHIIIPISSVGLSDDCLAGADTVQENPLFLEDRCSVPEGELGKEVEVQPSNRELQLQNNVAFFEQLAAIQTEARRKLRQAQTSACQTVTADRKACDFKRQIASILGNSNFTGGIGGSGGPRKLNRRLLTR